VQAQVNIVYMTNGLSEFWIGSPGDFAQRTCAPIAEPFMPRFRWAAIADYFPSILGIVVFLTFVTKIEIYYECAILFNLHYRRSSYTYDLEFEMGQSRGDNGGNTFAKSRIGDNHYHQHDQPHQSYNNSQHNANT